VAFLQVAANSLFHVFDMLRRCLQNSPLQISALNDFHDGELLAADADGAVVYVVQRASAHVTP